MIISIQQVDFNGKFNRKLETVFKELEIKGYDEVANGDENFCYASTTRIVGRLRSYNWAVNQTMTTINGVGAIELFAIDPKLQTILKCVLCKSGEHIIEARRITSTEGLFT